MLRPFGFSAIVSLLLCSVAVLLGVRSYHHHDRFGFGTSEARYTLHSAGGRLAFYRPPDPGPQTALAWQLASQISNDDAVWTVTHHTDYRNGHVFVSAAFQWRLGRPSAKMMSAFPPPMPGMGGVLMPASASLRSAAPPLLKALEDPRKAVAAYMCLVYLRGGGICVFNSHTERDTCYIDEQAVRQPLPGQLTVRVSKSGESTADTSVWRNLRDLWHDRLDVKVFSFNYAWLVAATVLLPLAWLVGALRRTLIRAGHCLTCGYDLKGNTSGICPECGTPAKREVETISN